MNVRFHHFSAKTSFLHPLPADPYAPPRTRADSLTPRERDIITLVVRGLLNKEIADQLSLALVTIKVHRGRAMRKMGAGNAAELAHLAASAGIVEGG